MFHRNLPLSFAFAAAALFATSLSVHAGQRKFTYVYETTTAPRGAVEVENWVTWQHTGGVARADEFDFRHELELGITPHLQLGIYLANWNYTDTDEESVAHYENSGAELIWNLTNPTTDFLGSALYFEVNAGNRTCELEGKLLLEKKLGPVTLAYNVGIEAEWAGHNLQEEKGGEFFQSFGASVEVCKHVSLGGELLHEIDIPDWRESEPSVLWLGPNASFRAGNFYATLTGLFRVTSNDEEPDVQTRLIFGFSF